MPYSGLLKKRPSQLWKERSTIWRPLEIPKICYPKLVKKECKRYIAGLYGDFEELTEARYKIYASKVTKNESALPPSENAAKYHIQRAAFQTLVWKRALTAQITEMPSPLEYGWNAEGIPIQCDRSPVHDQILITCNCKTTQCIKRSCKCFKNDLKCTDACMCKGCENHSEISVETDDGSDDSDVGE